MRKLTGWVFALAVLTATAVTVQADEKDKLVPEDGAVEVMLLRQRSVREDMKLSHDEAAKIDKHSAQQWKKAREINKLPDAERDKKFDELTKENDHFIDQTITKDQRKRLREIEMQVAGLMVVTRPVLAKKLNLTEEQIKRAHEMQKLGRQEMHDFIHASKPEKSDKLDHLRKTSSDRLVELLTDEQEKTWTKLAGAPFKGELEFNYKEVADK